MPDSIGTVLDALFVLADIYWLAKWGGDQALVVITVAAPVIGVLQNSSSFIFNGILAVVARCVGSNDTETKMLYSHQGLATGFLVGLVIGIAGIALIDPILSLYNFSPAISDMIKIYFIITCSLNPMYFLYRGICAIFVSHNNTKDPMLIAMMALIVNFVLDPIFIFGLGFIPGMGIQGAAWASFTSTLFALAGFFLFFFKPLKRYLPFSGLRTFVPNWRIVKEIFKIGTPASIGDTMFSLHSLMMIYLIASYGPAVTAAWGIASRIIALSAIHLRGLGVAVSTLVGQNLGADSPANARNVVEKSTRFGLFTQIVISVILIVWGAHLSGLFSSSLETTQESSHILVAFAIGFLANVSAIMHGHALRGKGNTICVMVASLLAFWVYKIPVCYTAAHVFNAESTVIYWLAASTLPVLAFIHYFFYSRDAWLKGG